MMTKASTALVILGDGQVTGFDVWIAKWTPYIVSLLVSSECSAIPCFGGLSWDSFGRFSLLPSVYPSRQGGSY